MLVPYVLSRGGNAITLSAALADEIETRAEATPCASPLEWGRGLARTVAGRRKPLTFGMVHPFSGHNFELRYWLAAAGIHPDQHVRIVAIPPPLMVESLVAGHVDGFCVGEPWSSLAVEHGIGRIVATKAQIFPHGIEKVLAVRPPIADRGVLAALLDALASAAAWVDEPANHAELAELLARPAYVGLGAELVARSLTGRIALGNGAVLADRDFLYFSRYDAGRPAQEEALWIYAQMLRWGQLAPHEDLRAKAAAVFRPDLYADGATTDVGDLADEVASAARDVEEYLRRFDLHTPFIDARSSA
jgi:NitT/TauT family transport system ATP-binding protein